MACLALPGASAALRCASLSALSELHRCSPAQPPCTPALDACIEALGDADVGVAIAACSALPALAAEKSMAQRAKQRGSLALLVEALRLGGACSERLCVAASHGIRALTTHDAPAKTACCVAGALPVLCSLLRAHPRSLAALCAVGGALASLSVKEECAEQAIACGCIDAVCLSLEYAASHPDGAAACAPLCVALSNLCLSSEAEARAVAKKGLHSAMQALRTHGDNSAQVAEEACALLSNLVTAQRHVRLAAELGVEALMDAASARHPGKEGVQQQVDLVRTMLRDAA